MASWQRDSILRPSERMACILPQDHGVLAGSIIFGFSDIPTFIFGFGLLTRSKNYKIDTPNIFTFFTALLNELSDLAAGATIFARLYIIFFDSDTLFC